MRMVLIKWVDSAFAQGWMSRDAVKSHQLSKCVSVGILVAENDEQITIMQSLSVDKDQMGDGLTIPKCSIKRIRKLRVS